MTQASSILPNLLILSWLGEHKPVGDMVRQQLAMQIGAASASFKAAVDRPGQPVISVVIDRIVTTRGPGDPMWDRDLDG